MAERDLSRAAALAAFLLLAACHAGPPPPDHSQLDALDARAFVRAQALSVHDLAAEVAMSVETPDFSGTLGGALLIAPPDRMRLRTSKLMVDVFDLLVTPDALELYWFPDRVLYRKSPHAGGEASGEAAGAATNAGGDARALAFLRDLDPGALRASLCAFELPAVDAAPRSPWQARARTETVRRTARALEIVTRLESGDVLTRRCDGGSLLLRSAEVATADGTPFLRVAYEDYRPAGALWLPRRSTMEDLRHHVVFRMEFSDLALNEGVLPGAFTLAIPADAKVVELR